MYLLHPFIFAIYPSLFLFFKNFKTVSSKELYLPLAVSLFLSSILILVFKFFLKDSKKATILTSTFLILFFSFGYYLKLINHLPLLTFSALSGLVVICLFSLIIFSFKKYSRVEKGLSWAKVILAFAALLLIYTYSIDFITKILSVSSLKLSRSDILLLTFAILFAVVFLLIKNRKNVTVITSLLNFSAVSLIVVLFFSLLFNIQTNPSREKTNVEDIIKEQEIGEKPNIYYIVLDGYGRSDVISKFYGYDNSRFINFLQTNGFYVEKNAYSNYSQTELSLSSSLNMDYIQDIVKNLDKNSDDKKILYDLIQKNQVVSFLKNIGYKFVSVSSGDSNTEFYNADLYLQDQSSFLTEFRNSLINTTPITSVPIKAVKNLQYEFHRTKIKYSFSVPEKINNGNIPIFAFIHILSPHPPFVFKSDFSQVNPNIPYSLADGSHFLKTSPKSDYIFGYKQQAEFVSKKTQEMISKIIKNPSESTIIIIQGDHGPGSELDQDSALNSNAKERMPILNAIRAPKLTRNKIGGTSTPVNTFRIIFNEYFNTGFDILPEKSYLSSYPKPYDFFDITQEVSQE